MKKVIALLLVASILLNGCGQSQATVTVNTGKNYGPYSVEVTAWDNTTGENVHHKTEQVAAGSWGPGFLYYTPGHRTDIKVVVSGGPPIPVGMNVVIKGPKRVSCGPLPGTGNPGNTITCTATFP